MRTKREKKTQQNDKDARVGIKLGNETNSGIFRSYFSTFWLGEPKCTEI